MRRFVDLHTHSTASDGTCEPAEVIRLADAARLAAVALTDHDTTDGLAEARRAAGGLGELRFVPGIEVSAEPPSGTLHILGLGIDESLRPIQDLAAFLRDARTERNPRIVAKLREMGIDMGMDDVLAAAAACGSQGQVISRLHIAEALVRKGHVATTAEAFERYIGKGCRGYAERRRPTPRQAVEAIRRAGGIAVLAHPVQLGCGNRMQLERIIRELMRAGLEAVEVYHPDHSPEQTRLYLDLAIQFKLGITGGSDFHGAGKPGVEVGRPRVPLAALGALADRLLPAAR